MISGRISIEQTVDFLKERRQPESMMVVSRDGMLGVEREIVVRNGD